MPELRHDPLSGRLVIVAPQRSARPTPPAPAGAPAGAAVDECPFCPGHEAMTPPEVSRTGTGEPDMPGWRVRVVPNLYPITDTHEVVVLSPAHDATFAALAPEQAVEVLGVLRDRVRAHLASKHAFVQALVNRGREAGASLAHPHGQVVALDLVPPAAEARVARFEAAGTDLVAASARSAADASCSVLAGPASVWCPVASGSPFAMLIAHASPGGRFDEAKDDDLADVALALRAALTRLDAAVGPVPYNTIVHTAPADRPAPCFHWYVEVLPRLAVPAGFEEGTGLLVNTVPPERAAEQLREATGA